MKKPKPKLRKKPNTIGLSEPKGWLYAIKSKRAGKKVAWMPDEVAITLLGEPKGKLLSHGGWAVIVTIDDAWPIARIEHNLKRIAKDWAEDFGKGWALRVRPMV